MTSRPRLTAAQSALVVLSVAILILVGMVFFQTQRGTCVNHYRSEWEISLGDIGLSLATGNDLTQAQIDRQDQAQHNLRRLNQLCSPGQVLLP